MLVFTDIYQEHCFKIGIISSEATLGLQMSVRQLRVGGNAIFSVTNEDRGLFFFYAHSSHI